MAYDKIITIRARLDDCLRYIQDGDKTALSRALDYIEDSNKTALGDEVILQSAINCTVENCYLDMQRTKERFGKPGGVVGYHLVHSYAPGETTPELAHEAGVEFARRLLGDKYQAVICTHVNKEHLHCHIVFNSVSFVDGVKYRNAFKDYFEDIRGISNEVSRKYGFSVIQPEGSGQHYAEWNAERSGKTTIRDLVRQDLDAAIAASFTFASLLDILKKRGYTVKYGSNVKHTAVKPPGGAQFLRLDSLGADYTEDAIMQRLRSQRSGTVILPQAKNPPKYYRIRRRASAYPPIRRGSFRALYLYYLYLLSPRKKRPQKISFETRAEIRRVKQYRQQFFLLQKYRVDTKPELDMLSDALSNEMQIIIDQRKELYALRRLHPSEQLDTEIAALTERLRPLRRELRLCGRIAEYAPRMLKQVQECNSTPIQNHAPEQARERRSHLWR